MSSVVPCANASGSKRYGSVSGGAILRAWPPSAHSSCSRCTRLWVSLETYVSILAAEPHFARVLLIEVLGAGPRALAMRERILAIYVEHYRGLYALAQQEQPELPDIPDDFLRALVGGIAELVQQCLLESPAAVVSQRLRELTPALVSFATAVLTSRRDAVPARAAG